ncbi:MAG TPA: GNAT family N-acetyltransferase [Gemmatimonadales bacterium]|nr:GNAT family N-acetyltransferase [Gemmatimonadales bacterium]
MSTRRLKADDRAEWLRLRRQLWPALDEHRHATEVRAMLADEARFATFGYFAATTLAGFVEASLRERPDVLPPGRMGYIEALFVAPDYRGKGVGRALLQAAERWAEACDCEIMGSDAEVGNQAGVEIHRKLGYQEAERIVRFQKALA